MRNNRSHNTSGVPGKRKASRDENERNARRPEGTVAEHRSRVSKAAGVDVKSNSKDKKR